MNSSTRILKETRALFWPWCAVLFAAALNLLPRRWLLLSPFLLSNIDLMGFAIGVPLLATLSLGNEFQYRTLSLLLSQPIDRRKIWAEKWIVLIVAVLSAASAYWFSWSRPMSDLQLSFIAGLAMVAICSAMFWTILARSVIGGLVLNAFQIGAILFGFRVLSSVLRGSSPAAIAVLAYAVFMLWLGRRKLLRLQVADGMAGGDLLMSSPSVMRPVATLVRSRQSGALLNVIRKEARLLWPVWMLALFAIVFLICMTPFRFASDSGNTAFTFVSIVSILILIVAAILAGSLSLGEERTWGTHSWHMTMPFSVRKQWFIKLLVAILGSLVSTAVVTIVGQFLFGQYVYQTFGPNVLSSLLLGLSLLCVAAFWCASVVKGTVRAALLVFPAVASIALPYKWGVILADGGIFLGSTVSRFHPFPFSDSTERILSDIEFGRFTEFWPVVVVVLFALIQTYGLFRIEPRDGFLGIIRHLVPVLILVFVCGFLQLVPYVLLNAANTQTWNVLRETSKAVDKLNLDPTKLDPARPLQLTLDDLAKTSPVSDPVRRALRDTTITVTPRAITRRFGWDGRNRRWITESSAYFSTVHLKNDWSCSMYGSEYLVFSCTSPSGHWGYPAFP